MLSAFLENLITDTIRVYPPQEHLLLCGGFSDITIPGTTSLRDAFLKNINYNKLGSIEILQIEEILEFFEKSSPYIDLVDFEKDIAQICELVLLFSESAGSFTELGSFCTFSEIREKMLLAIQSEYISQKSFIAVGPVANLKREYPNSVYSIPSGLIGIKKIDGLPIDMSKVDGPLLFSELLGPIKTRMEEAKNRTTLDTSKFNHLCKSYIGILREFYCLKDEEIIHLLTAIGFTIDPDRLRRVAFCCKALKWSSYTDVGFDQVHFALPGLNEAAKFEFKNSLNDKIRRRANLRKHWEDNDKARLLVVDEMLQ